MSRDNIALSSALSAYVHSVGVREDADLALLREETANHPDAEMQISPEQGQLMALLVRLIGARKTLDIGVFTGYSALAVAKAMGPEGTVVALDVNERVTEIARRHWAKSGVASRIELRLQAAARSLEELVSAGESGSFDFAFIDADKPSYDTYYEYALQLVRPGGLIVLDNVLRGGQVINQSDQSDGTVTIRALNQKIHADQRVQATMLSIGDGVTLAIKN